MIHVNRGATSLGVFSEEEVREGLGTGRFATSDIGWREGMANWQPLSQFAELPGATAAAPPLQTGAASISAPPAPRSGLPWDHRQERGFFNAFIETLVMVLTKPGEAFTAMKREGGLGEPLLYAIIGGTFGGLFAVTYNFALRSFASFGDRHGALAHLFGGLGWIFLLVLTPFFVVIGMFLASAILHVCLMIVGGAKQSFETTFRVVCFAEGSAGPLLVIPFCGGLITGIWKVVLYCIGLARSHETEIGRAVVAVLLPLIVCCGGGILLFAIILGAWGLPQH
ncbi:MAG: YIP1 family protein [Candidatus Udaeobacter sp.]